MILVKPYCQKLRLLFDARHDGELSSFLDTVIQRHLAACESCRNEYALLQGAIAAVKAKTAPDVPARVLREVIENLTNPDGGAPQPDGLPGLGFLEGLETT